MIIPILCWQLSHLVFPPHENPLLDLEGNHTSFTKQPTASGKDFKEEFMFSSGAAEFLSSSLGLQRSKIINISCVNGFLAVHFQPSLCSLPFPLCRAEELQRWELMSGSDYDSMSHLLRFQ